MDLTLDKKAESSGRYNSSTLKSCSGCHTTKTPLWRGGPAGPKSLCNACGIKYHKKRRQLLGLDSGKPHEKKKRSKVVGRSNDVRESLKTRFVVFGRDLSVLRGSGKLMAELREEERAAIVLMALSGGSVYAFVE